MAQKTQSEPQSKSPTPDWGESPFSKYAAQNWMGTAWLENVAELSSEMIDFLASRIREDVRTQHQLLHCKTLPEIQHVQAEFMQRAFDQYSAESGKLVERSSAMFSSDSREKEPSTSTDPDDDERSHSLGV